MTNEPADGSKLTADAEESHTGVRDLAAAGPLPYLAKLLKAAD